MLAPWYRTLEWIAFGDDLQCCRVACLREIDAPRRALMVGEGNGRFLCELLRMHPEVEIDCIDASQRMLQLARKRIDRELSGQAERVRFLHQDITSWAAPEYRYDLLVTHFFLDCFPEPVLAGIIKKLARSATNDVNWLLADFCVPPNGMARSLLWTNKIRSLPHWRWTGRHNRKNILPSWPQAARQLQKSR